ncbi:MAG TPA: hypothetical protein VMR97_01600 [Acidimicrobiales bacterium]|nr:hypothetical protein [Acidimicrobiales bacterium]
MAVFETLTFRLKPETDEVEFRLADRAVQGDFVRDIPGFVQRTTCRSRDWEWFVVTVWETEHEADKAKHLGESSRVMEKFFSFIDRESSTAKRYTSLD